MTTLRDIRVQAGLTQAELADRSGVRQATISAIENGRSKPHRGTLLAIGQVLSVPPEELQHAVNQPVKPITSADNACTRNASSSGNPPGLGASESDT